MFFIQFLPKKTNWRFTQANFEHAKIVLNFRSDAAAILSEREKNHATRARFCNPGLDRSNSFEDQDSNTINCVRLICISTNTFWAILKTILNSIYKFQWKMRTSCQVMILCTGFPVCLFHVRKEPRWLAIPKHLIWESGILLSSTTFRSVILHSSTNWRGSCSTLFHQSTKSQQKRKRPSRSRINDLNVSRFSTHNLCFFIINKRSNRRTFEKEDDQRKKKTSNSTSNI